MRIGGSSSSRSGMGSSSRSERLKAFRRRMREGDRLVAVMRSWVEPGLALLAVNDLEITAQLGGNPMPGQSLTLEVVALYPEIVLKEVKGAGGSAGSSLLNAVASAFCHNHTAFEDSLRNILPGEADPEMLHQAFGTALAEHPELDRAFADLKAVLDEMNAVAASRGLGQVHIAPWLCPSIGGAQALIRVPRQDGTLPAVGNLWPEGAVGLLRFTLPDGHPVEARLHTGPPAVLFFSAVPKLEARQLSMAVHAFFPAFFGGQALDMQAAPAHGFAGELLQRMQQELSAPRLHLDVRV